MAPTTNPIIVKNKKTGAAMIAVITFSIDYPLHNSRLFSSS